MLSTGFARGVSAMDQILSGGQRDEQAKWDREERERLRKERADEESIRLAGRWAAANAMAEFQRTNPGATPGGDGGNPLGMQRVPTAKAEPTAAPTAEAIPIQRVAPAGSEALAMTDVNGQPSGPVGPAANEQNFPPPPGSTIPPGARIPSAEEMRISGAPQNAQPSAAPSSAVGMRRVPTRQQAETMYSAMMAQVDKATQLGRSDWALKTYLTAVPLGEKLRTQALDEAEQEYSATGDINAYVPVLNKFLGPGVGRQTVIDQIKKTDAGFEIKGKAGDKAFTQSLSPREMTYYLEKVRDPNTARALIAKHAETLAQKGAEMRRNEVAGAAADPSDQGIAQAAQKMVKSGVMEPAEARRWQASMTAIQDPAQRRARLAEQSRTPDQLVDAYKPKIEKVDNGQTITHQDVNPLTNPSAGAPVQRQMTPGEQQHARDAAASRAVTMRGQNMTDARARDQIRGEGGKAADDLRKEFNALPEVKEFKAIIPAQQAATDAIKRDTAQADINLVYTVAKIFDPTSVVREGEYATVNSSQAPAERIQGLFNHLRGGGKLTADTRRALLAEVNSRANAGKASYDAALKSYGAVADKRGLARGDVFQELSPLSPDPAPAPSPAPAGKGRPSMDSFFR